MYDKIYYVTRNSTKLAFVGPLNGRGDLTAVIFGFFNKFGDMPLRRKLFICIMLLIILPLITAGLFLNNQFTDISIRKSCETNLQILKQTRQSFEDMISDANDLSIGILRNDNVQALAKYKLDNTQEFNELYTEISRWLDDVIGSKAYFHSICLYKGNEILFQKGGLIEAEDPASIKKAVQMNGRGFWTDVYNIEANSGANTVISFYRGIMDFGMLDRNIAVERISVNEETLYGFYRNINPYKGGKIFLTDADGFVLSSSDKETIGADFSKYEHIKKALQQKEGFFLATIENEKSVVLHYTVSGPNWQLIETIPLESFMPGKTAVNMVIVIAVLLCILFGILFSIIQSIYLVKPLSRLHKEMYKLRKGDFHVALNTQRKDEIGEINLGFTEMASQLEKTINDVYIGKIKQREAELIALEAQINPHFLYNTLDSIHWLALKNRDYDVSEQIEALSGIFKHVLNKGREIVSVREEIDFLKDYMFLQKAKYGDRITLDIRVENDSLEYATPKLILQPLVENAILHGLEQKVEGGTIQVDIAREDGILRFVVRDDGKGSDEAKIRSMLADGEQSTNIFALKNIDERIKLRFGDSYGLSFHSREGSGTRVEVRLPALRQEISGS